jgi:predicted naringenin-chalcone synthase
VHFFVVVWFGVSVVLTVVLSFTPPCEQTVIFDSVARVLAQTGTKAKSIDILVVNCSLFSPTPSLASMVINQFGMRQGGSKALCCCGRCLCVVLPCGVVSSSLACPRTSHVFARVRYLSSMSVAWHCAVARLFRPTPTAVNNIRCDCVTCCQSPLTSPTDSSCPLSLPVLLDVSSYNLSGMGCSAGIISIELVKNMLAAKPNSTALIVSI